MNELLIEVRKLAELEMGILPDGIVASQQDIPDFLFVRAWGAVEAAGRSDPAGVWDILRNGTDAEFSALCNCLPEIAGEFDEDDNMREIVKIAKHRLVNAADPENIMAGIHGYVAPSLFDQFWNEPEPTIKARTFSQIMQA